MPSGKARSRHRSKTSRTTEQLSKQASARVTAFAGLKQEAERLGCQRCPVKSSCIQKAWVATSNWRNSTGPPPPRPWTTVYNRLLKVLGDENQALTGVVGELKSFVEVSRKEELLKRQSAGTLWGTVKPTFKSLMEMPGRAGPDPGRPRPGAYRGQPAGQVGAVARPAGAVRDPGLVGPPGAAARPRPTGPLAGRRA